MLFVSVKEINRLLKETNRLLSKGMSNVYINLTIEKKWRTQNFDLLRFFVPLTSLSLICFLVFWFFIFHSWIVIMCLISLRVLLMDSWRWVSHVGNLIVFLISHSLFWINWPKYWFTDTTAEYIKSFKSVNDGDRCSLTFPS